MRSIRTLLALSAAVAFPACSPAPPPAPANETAADAPVAAPRSPDEWTVRVARALAPRETAPGVEGALAAQEQERRALIVRGRDHTDAIQALLIDRGIAMDSVDSSGHLLRTGAAVRLSMLDYTRQLVERLDQAGIPIVRAAVAAQRGTETLEDRVLLSPSVTLVEATAPAVGADLDDGFTLSQRLRVVESLKGAFAAGTHLVLRARDRKSALAPGERRLAFLSGDSYRHQALSVGRPPMADPNLVMHLFPPIEGESALAEARSRAAAFAAAERAARTALPVPRRHELWLLDTADGRQGDPSTYWIHASHGQASGGRDGCNWWGRDPDRPDSVVSTAMGCPPDPVRDSYQAVLMRGASPAGRLHDDGSLRFERDGRLLVFRRVLD